MTRSVCFAALPAMSRSFTGSTAIWPERKTTRSAGAWMAWLYGPTALGALALCTALRSVGMGATAGAAGCATGAATAAGVAVAAASGAAAATTSGVVFVTGSETLALECAHATIATTTNEERTRINYSPFVSRVPIEPTRHHRTGSAFARVLVPARRACVVAPATTSYWARVSSRGVSISQREACRGFADRDRSCSNCAAAR
jgi:hypothetical protein